MVSSVGVCAMYTRPVPHTPPETMPILPKVYFAELIPPHNASSCGCAITVYNYNTQLSRLFSFIMHVDIT